MFSRIKLILANFQHSSRSRRVLNDSSTSESVSWLLITFYSVQCNFISPCKGKCINTHTQTHTQMLNNETTTQSIFASESQRGKKRLLKTAKKSVPSDLRLLLYSRIRPPVLCIFSLLCVQKKHKVQPKNCAEKCQHSTKQ